MSRTVVVGAGVIGLACAWELRKRGEDVLVVDRGEAGAACSAGNAGWITPSISTPLPSPGLVGTSMRWMMKRDSPLYIKPRPNPAVAAWLATFWRNCSEDVYQRGLAALADLNSRTMPLFDQWQSEGIDFEMHKAGLLFLGLSEEAVAATAEEVAHVENIGYKKPKVLSGNEVRDLEPGLTQHVAGGFWIEEERHIRPETLTGRLVEQLNASGVETRAGVNVTGVTRKFGTITGVTTTEGSIAADRVLLAAGSWTGQLADSIGFKLPIEAGKGYSVTIEMPRRTITRPLDLIEARVAVTPFDEGLRLAGTMELSGLNLKLEPRRVEAIRQAGDRYLGDWRGGRNERVWVGMRPLTPDGLPVIGRVPGTDNLYVASGHQMLGVTMAPATGEVVAELMIDGTSHVDLQPFAPGRFTTGVKSGRESRQPVTV